MQRVLLMTTLVLVTACSRQHAPAPTAESQSDNAAASAPNGVGSQRDVNGRPGAGTGTAQNTPNETAPPSATAQDQTRNTGQSATSRSSADQQGLTASPPD
jgi:hypothetical protein